MEVKIMDGNETIYKDMKTFAHANDTIYQINQLFKDIRSWNAETPNLYMLVVNTFDSKGNPLESFTHPFGFRSIEMKMACN